MVTISQKSACLGILGLGYVGLPMAAIFAKRGFKVLGGDINPKIVNAINRGESPINEKGLGDIVDETVRRGMLRATCDTDAVVKESDVVIVVVQTPIDESKKPDLTVIKAVLRTISKNLTRGKLIIIESTLPPGATHETVIPLLEKSGLKAGEDFYLAYSPERAIPTSTLEEIQKNSRIIGGITKESALLAKRLYSHITSGEIIIGDIKTVELVKVIENTYRDVNIALSNEIAMIGEKLGVDAVRAIEMANKHPRVNLLQPGTGVGGHCIPKDPYFLVNKAEELGVELRVISSARKVNEDMPKHVLSLIETALKSANKSICSSKVAVLGIAYKGNTDDTRSTPSKEVIETLMGLHCDVFSHDPYVSQDFGGKFSNRIEDAVIDADCLVIITDHDEYKHLDLEALSKNLKKPGIIVDGRRVIDPQKAEDLDFHYFGVGYR
ncbi:MAG: nucleotide sugar dehydrogenase [Candidatus Hydrothermarchaeaceae archaeon]